MFGRLLEKFIRKRAREIVDEMIRIRNFLNEQGLDVTPREILKTFAGDRWLDIENAMMSGRPRSEIIIFCLQSFEGIAYWIEMEGTGTLGQLLVQRWWSFCQYVDDFIRDAGFPSQSKETKLLIFEQLQIDKGNFQDYL